MDAECGKQFVERGAEVLHLLAELRVRFGVCRPGNREELLAAPLAPIEECETRAIVRGGAELQQTQRISGYGGASLDQCRALLVAPHRDDPTFAISCDEWAVPNGIVEQVRFIDVDDDE